MTSTGRIFSKLSELRLRVIGIDARMPTTAQLTRKSMQRLVTPFGFQSTAAEVAGGIELTSKRIIITGGAAGVGLATASVLASAGAEITLAVRRPEAAQAVPEQLRQTIGNPAIEVRQLDLSDLCSVHSFVDDWAGPLHLIDREFAEGLAVSAPEARSAIRMATLNIQTDPWHPESNYTVSPRP